MLIRIHSVVEEAKGRHIENHGALQWLSELIDSEYQGRYLLDTIGCTEHELEGHKQGEKVAIIPQASSLSMFNTAKRIKVAACAVKSVLLGCDIGVEEIDRVMETLQLVSGDLGEFIMLLQGYKPIRRPLATNIFIDSQIFGRHVEKETVINFLLHDRGDHPTGEFSVLPILGDNGAGKKTLVHHACNVMPGYADTSRSSCCSISHVLMQLRQMEGLLFFGTSTSVEVPGICGKKGSKIIFTTNNRHVASMGTVEPITLKVLPFPEYWFLFKAHAFAGRDIEENPRLVAAGKAIARKLNRSFFGAKIIGELLKDHLDPKVWCKILRSNIGGVSLLGDGVYYVADLAENLWPSNVNLSTVCISKVSSVSQAELARFQDMYEPHGSEPTHFADDSRSAKVLLCKSVLPFYNIYYASCTIGPKSRC